VFGDRVLIQRCTLHKRRNVIGYLPVDERDAIDKRLAIAFAQPEPAKGIKACQDLAGQLERDHPDAAGSLREGLEEMFTVARLEVPKRLRVSLTNTNCIESMISIARDTTGRVKHWKNGAMKKRWIAASMLEAERSFRRIKGHADMPAFVAAVHRATNPATPANYADVA
jgi:transposase-like protein